MVLLDFFGQFMAQRFETYIAEIPLSQIQYDLPQPRKDLKFDKGAGWKLFEVSTKE